MCEFLIKAKNNWMLEAESIGPDDDPILRKDWDAETIKKMERGGRVGNPIVVKPDGWKWGKRECPPDFVVVKVLDMTVEEGEEYLGAAYDYTAKPTQEGIYPIAYRKKYVFDNTDIDVAKLTNSTITVTKTVFQNKLTERQL